MTHLLSDLFRAGADDGCTSVVLMCVLGGGGAADVISTTKSFAGEELQADYDGTERTEQSKFDAENAV